MKSKFFTFSIMLLLTTCSFGTVVHTTDEPHKRRSAIYKLLEREDEDDE